jgi:hypothetical protein
MEGMMIIDYLLVSFIRYRHTLGERITYCFGEDERLSGTIDMAEIRR